MFTWTPEMIRLMQNANARSEYHRQLAAIHERGSHALTGVLVETSLPKMTAL